MILRLMPEEPDLRSPTPAGDSDAAGLDLSREHPEPRDPPRRLFTPALIDDAGEATRPLAESALDLDRERIIHSSAFRRLQFKTQAFGAGEGDNVRTRLAHTLEVANLARRIAQRLGLCVELAEVAALGHDLGHPPFGHAGEAALNERMREFGGFEHNAQSLRVVEYLEHPFPQFRGLNLTRVTRECLAKHATRYDKPGAHPLQDGRPPPLEGQAAALADQIAYSLHDVQDGLYQGLIEPSALNELALWRETDAWSDHREDSNWRAMLRTAVDRVRNALIDDIVAESRRRARAGDARALLAARRVSFPVISFSERVAALVDAFGAFLLERVYRSAPLARMDHKAKRLIQEVFDEYVRNPRLMPARYAERVETQGAARVATDYIAGMTDRFCRQEHVRLFDPRTGP